MVERITLTVTGLVALGLLWDYQGAGFPWGRTGFVVLMVALLILAVRLRLRSGRTTTENVFLVHMMADIVLLAFAFHQTGGIENPFLLFFMLPLTLAAYALSWPRLLGSVLAVSLLMLLLTRFHLEVGNFDESVHEASELIAVALVTYFAYAVARMSRVHDRAVARAREEALNVLGLQAVGSVAARAADSISTPLSTMAVLVHELREERLPEAERRAALDVLETQIALCKSQLSALLASVGHPRGETGERRDIRMLVNTAVRECELIDPDLKVDVDQPTRTAPQVVEERSLLDAFVLLIRHCGRSEPHKVRIAIRWDQHWVRVRLQGREEPAERDGGTPPGPAGVNQTDATIALAATMIGRFNGSLSCRVKGQDCFMQANLPTTPNLDGSRHPGIARHP